MDEVEGWIAFFEREAARKTFQHQQISTETAGKIAASWRSLRAEGERRLDLVRHLDAALADAKRERDEALVTRDRLHDIAGEASAIIQNTQVERDAARDAHDACRAAATRLAGDLARMMKSLEMVRDADRRDLYSSTYIARQALAGEGLDPRGEPCAKCGGFGPCACAG